MGMRIEEEDVDSFSPVEINQNPFLLMLFRKLERQEILIDSLVRRGLIRPEELEIANLKALMNHARRVIRVREKQGLDKDCSDLIHAKEVIQEQMTDLERRLTNPV